jgi:1-acyl-sn-glycerol-3-phosphate acyltransferase
MIHENRRGKVSSSDTGSSEVTKWDPQLTERVMGWIRPIIKGYHRSRVRGLDSFPSGGVLVVSNHSGGLFALDVPVFATGFYDRFGYDRPVYTLSHDILVTGPAGDTAALNAEVPIVPAVSIGGQENQLYLSRGEGPAKLLGLDKLRLKILPISFGFPFGLSVMLPVNVPLPTKIVTQVLKPIDILAQFGADPDIDQVDAHVRHVMQQALDRLADERRFPVLG